MLNKTESTVIQQETSLQIAEYRRGLQRAQDRIFRFWLDQVKKESPDQILHEFNRLFIHHDESADTTVIRALYEILIANDREEFINTLKRSCYILINNWAAARNHQAIQKLVDQVFTDAALEDCTASLMLNRLREWVAYFVESKDYSDLKLFAARYDEHKEENHWSERYTSYLLVNQYVNLKNSPEQREAAKTRAQQLKERFKFDLAMYTARSHLAAIRKDQPKNPSSLGDEVLALIKLIVAKRGTFSYNNLANIFLEQTKDLYYDDFKQSLQNYLIYSVDNRDCVEALKIKLSKKLKPLYREYDDQHITEALVLRTCKRVIEFLTTENNKTPSSLFVLLLSQGHPITLVIILLKVTLICKPVHTHLEACLGSLIEYYINYPEQECRWVVNFLEILKITFVIYDDTVQYNLLNMSSKNLTNQVPLSLENYRIFSQRRWQLEAEAAEAAEAGNSVESNGSSESTPTVEDETEPARVQAEYYNPFDLDERNLSLDLDPFSDEVEQIFAE